MLDCCIIGAGASGLFCGMLLPREWKKCILEKNSSAGVKILLSGKWRCNFTNINVSDKTYVWDQTERLKNYLSQFWPKDMIKFLEDHWIQSQQEDFWRMLLKSNKARELLDFLLEENKKNLTEIEYNHAVISIQKQLDYYVIRTNEGTFESKRVIIATGGQSFPKVWGSDFISVFWKEQDIAIHTPAPALCWLETKEDLSSLSWSSVSAEIKLTLGDKTVYQEEHTVLFTHWGVSGPGIFNASLWLGYLDPELTKKAKIRLLITKDQITKRLLAYLKAPKGLRNYTMTLTPIALRSWDEAKVMSWGLLMEEVNENFELKKLPWVYLLWEALNITGKTGWYNLQWCWTSAFCCAKAMGK